MAGIPDYSRATNAAYIELQRYTGSYPAIDVWQIIKSDEHIRVKSFTEAAFRLGCTHNEFAYEIASSESGYTVIDSNTGNSIIYYNNLKCEETIRFVLSHELGHIRLGHKEDNDIANKEANCFARNLLCPVPVVQEAKILTAEEYVETFYISHPMAEVAVQYYKSDLYYARKDLIEEIRNRSYCAITGYSLREIYGCYM